LVNHREFYQDHAIVKTIDIIQQRLRNQRLSSVERDEPAEVVQWLGAVQAQDFYAAKWALGLRVSGATDEQVERAFDDGAILRTHLMRPTWHFVAPADIRWMLALTSARVHAANAYQYRKLELDAPTLKRSRAAIVKALRDGRQLMREELRAVIEKAGVATDTELRLGYILMHAELDGVICSGPRRGKQFTYAVLEERVPPSKSLSRSEALALLARRFFRSHGPATIHDFAKWSGLTISDAKKGLEEVKGELEQSSLEDAQYWFPPALQTSQVPSVLLLPIYDEYTIGYKDHSAVFDRVDLSRLKHPHTLVLDGRVSGTWKRTLTRTEVLIEIDSFHPFGTAETRSLKASVEAYGRFLSLAARLI
jgi:hypothetical protein